MIYNKIMDGSRYSMIFNNFLMKRLGTMKRKSLCTTFLILSAVLILSSCQNSSWNFPDYQYQSVYFAYQYPVRTIVLGESKFNNELDNNHQFEIMATTAGVYDNENHVMVDYEVDESMISGLQFEGSSQPIQALPDNYYNFMSDSDQLVIPEGQLAGGVKVQLTDAFFEDPEAINTTYVIPMKMTGVANADTILSGNAKDAINNPRRAVVSDWDVVPKDYTFYAVKYINRWDGYYLHRFAYDITRTDGSTETVVSNADYIVNDQVSQLHTQSLTETEFPLTYTDTQGQNVNATLLLTVDDQGNVTVSDESGDYTASGSGTFINKSESDESWGDEPRNAIYLEYEIDWDQSQRHVESADTLVLRDRGVGTETFTPQVP